MKGVFFIECLANLEALIKAPLVNNNWLALCNFFHYLTVKKVAINKYKSVQFHINKIDGYIRDFK